MRSTQWQRSSFTANSNNCIEVRTVEGVVELRESENGDVIVRTTPVKFARFLSGVKAGEFDQHGDFRG
ncbi:DUF397 domain-containing protein [Kitasatospora sp. NPDC006697]|uniref:DUF397 domain-containing protein n=1 Tax=Kitasatospora sp. NPDC006697 TaxID=3364020 RepID=UPI003673AC8E